jgi:hypothetical protein
MKTHLGYALALLTCGSGARAQNLIGVDWNSGQLYSISTTTGVASPGLSTGLAGIADIAMAPSGTLYAMTTFFAGPSSLYRIDVGTGAPTLVGTIGAQISEGGLTFAPNGTLYGVQTPAAGGRGLFTLDPMTAALTPVGIIAGAADLNGIAWRGDGYLIALEHTTATGARVMIVDPTNALVVTTFMLPANIGSISGMAYQGATLYIATGAVGSSVQGLNSLYTFDPFTGLSQLVGSLGAAVVGDGVCGLAGSGGCGQVTPYCTAGTTSNGCAALISSVGTPSATATSGFTLFVSGVDGQRQGILFYGVSGQQALQWATGSTSYLCVKPPVQRMGVQSSGGTLFQCDGMLSIDWNAFRAANPSALGNPFVAGQSINAQAWFRDPPSSKTTSLSDALRFVTCP